ncbi:hypothetical protein NIES50_69670 (plasmid) [Aulosira laxa NIES-50]|nr:hypothetical protein NIES50_69670 [Aulosira laxa NIES-50]
MFYLGKRSLASMGISSEAYGLYAQRYFGYKSLYFAEVDSVTKYY